MSIIASGTTTTNALVSTGNTDGTLQFQVNGTTPSVTLNTLGAVGVGSSPSYGTSGQVLASAGSTSAPTWTNQSALSVGSATTATNLAGGGAGQIPYNTGSGTTAFLAAGTTGQALISNGTSAPSWGSAGAMTLISTSTVSAASSAAFTGLSSTYSAYLIVVTGLYFSVNYATFGYRLSSNNGSSYDSGSGNYSYAGIGYESSATGYTSIIPQSSSYYSDSTQVIISGSNSNLSTRVTSGQLWIYSPSSSVYTNSTSHFMSLNGSNYFYSSGSGAHLSAAAQNAIQLIPSSGTITGTFKLYGIT